jgi:hypothetical protein
MSGREPPHEAPPVRPQRQTALVPGQRTIVVMLKATLMLTLCLAACGGSDQRSQSDGERRVSEARLTAAFAEHDLPVTPAYDTGSTDEVCSLFLGHDPGTRKELIFYVWLLKTEEAARSYEKPDLSPIVNPAAITRIHNLVLYVPEHFSDEWESRIEAVERELEQQALSLDAESVCGPGN